MVQVQPKPTEQRVQGGVYAFARVPPTLAFRDQQLVQHAENGSEPQEPRHVQHHGYQGHEHRGLIDGDDREDEDNRVEVNRGTQEQSRV